MFCWFCFARLLRLSLDRSWAIVHPSRKQSQPPAYFAALLVNRIVGASAAPAVSHLKPLPHFTDFLWELRRQPRLPSVRKTPLATFGATFFGTAKLKNFGQILKNASFGHNQAKFGQFCIFWGPNSAAILRQFCGGRCPHVGFCLEKSIFWPRKTQKKNRFWQKTLREYFGFSAAILRKILKGQNPSPNGPDCIFQRSQRASEVLQALSPLTATNLLVLAAW